MQPSELVLNPSKLLRLFDQLDNASETPSTGVKFKAEDVSFTVSEAKHCWICYDVEKKEVLIEPCRCKGDVSSVHHECLRRWLIRSASKNKASRCQICECEYDVTFESEKIKWTNGLRGYRWNVTVMVVICMSVVLAGSLTLIYLCSNPYVQILSATAAFLVWYTCFRFLSRNALHVYQRAKIAALNVARRTDAAAVAPPSDSGGLSTKY